MAGLVPAIHVFWGVSEIKDVDARHEAGHDEREACGRIKDRIAGVNLRNGFT
jgi:hypothetical protein